MAALLSHTRFLFYLRDFGSLNVLLPHLTLLEVSVELYGAVNPCPTHLRLQGALQALRFELFGSVDLADWIVVRVVQLVERAFKLDGARHAKGLGGEIAAKVLLFRQDLQPGKHVLEVVLSEVLGKLLLSCFCPFLVLLCLRVLAKKSFEFNEVLLILTKLLDFLQQQNSLSKILRGLTLSGRLRHLLDLN